ncbi:MAG: hypothetical protein K2M95_05550 [Clostridiales bacterium]|nr:hypothetical protein [Clostridiales bacterium]
MKKETKKALKGYLATAGVLYLFSFVLSIFSVIFILDKIPKWIQFIVSFLFMAPLFYLAFANGLASGEKMYKENAQVALGDLHGEKSVSLPYYKCIYHVLGFVLPLCLLFTVAILAKVQVLKVIGCGFVFPVVLLFSSINVISAAKVALIDLAVVLPYILVLAGTFIFGYIFKAWRLKKQRAELQSELRSFDN